MKEPFPNSIYGNFFSETPIKDPNVNLNQHPKDLISCSNMGTCYQDAYKNSKTLMPVSAPLIECVKRMLVKLLVSESVCRFGEAANISFDSTSHLYQFQLQMRRGVTALLTIYIIFFGFRIIMGSSSIKSSDFILTIIKFILVVYFSIGINDPANPNSTQMFSGMVDWAFPLMFNGADQLTNWVMGASSSDLCNFSHVKYESGYEYIAIWDALDCRVANYLGLNSIIDLFSTGEFSIPPYLLLVIPAITTGNILLAQAAFAYPLFVISVAAYMVNAFIVCMITITILGMLSPIFVPMALFNYTKGYFDSWLKLMISFVLQPIIVAGFMVLMFAVYDSTFYDSCKYKTYVVNSNKKTYVAGSGENISSANHLFFSIDTDKNNYKIEEFDQCTQSFGYLLNGALAVYLQITNPEIAITAVTGPGHFNQMADFVTSVAGLFTDSHGLTLNKVMNLLVSLITCCFVLYLMYNFSAQLSEFAADVTGGISVAKMGIGAQTLFQKGMNGIKAIGEEINKARGIDGVEPDKDDEKSTDGSSIIDAKCTPVVEATIVDPKTNEDDVKNQSTDLVSNNQLSQEERDGGNDQLAVVNQILGQENNETDKNLPRATIILNEKDE